MDSKKAELHGTTIICVRVGEDIVIGADGQVSFGNTVLKSTAKKLRTLTNGSIVAGFAGSTADALTLFERLEAKLEKHSGQLPRACVELAKDWRTDKFLRRLEAMLIVADKRNTFIITGNGDVVEPEHNIAAIGSGGMYALAAARGMMECDNNTTAVTAEDIVRKSLTIAADICVFSNHNIIIEKVK